MPEKGFINDYGDDQCPECSTKAVEISSIGFATNEVYIERHCMECEVRWKVSYYVYAVSDVRNDQGKILCDEESFPDYHSIIEELLDNKDRLPTLMGLSQELDELIEQRLKN